MKGKGLVLDTGPLFLYFAGDREATAIIDSGRRGEVDLYTCEVIMAEFYYKTCEKFGRDVAELRSRSIRKSGINIDYIDEKLTHVAGILRCTHRAEISLADAYILALCRVREAQLITTDGLLKQLNLVPTRLLRVLRRKDSV